MSSSILTVVTPAPAPQLLATADGCKAEIGADGDDTRIATLLPQASAAIAAHCHRVFGRETVTETWRAVRAEVLILSRIPVQAIAKVVEDGVELGEDDYECDPGAGLLYRLCGGQRRPWGARSVVVTYDAGWRLPGQDDRDLPEDVERACVLTVLAWYKAQGRDPMLRSEQSQDVGSQSWIATADMSVLPPQAISVLEDGGYMMVA